MIRVFAPRGPRACPRCASHGEAPRERTQAGALSRGDRPWWSLRQLRGWPRRRARMVASARRARRRAG